MRNKALAYARDGGPSPLEYAVLDVLRRVPAYHRLVEDDFPKMAAPARRALANGGFTRLADLATVTEAEVARLHGMGPNALRVLREALAAAGLSFSE